MLKEVKVGTHKRRNFFIEFDKHCPYVENQD